MNLTLRQSAVRLLAVRHRLGRLEGLEGVTAERIAEVGEEMLDTARHAVWAHFADEARREGIEPVRLHPIREAEFLARPAPKAMALMGRHRPPVVRLGWLEQDRFFFECPEHPGTTWHLSTGCGDCQEALEALPIDIGGRLAVARERQRAKAFARHAEQYDREVAVALDRPFSRFLGLPAPVGSLTSDKRST